MRTDRPGGKHPAVLMLNEEKEGRGRKHEVKYRFRGILSGMMAAVTILSAVISPLTVYASEEPKAVEPPAYECVKDLLMKRKW